MVKKYVSTKKEDIDPNEDLLDEIRKNFKICQEVYSNQRQQSEEDYQFRLGNHWDENIKNQRDRDGKPSLVINKLPQFVSQVCNNQKQNRPSININPYDSQADIATAKVFQGIIKNIESRSMAENAYDNAFECAVTGGEGYFRIITKYSDPMSFDQEIFIKPIDNPFSVYLDPDFKSDFSGIKYAFIFDEIPKDKFEKDYPDAKATNQNVFNLHGSDWVRQDLIRIAEYFYFEKQDFSIVQLKTGDVMPKKDYDALSSKHKDLAPVVKERISHKKVLKWVKTNGFEILEENEFPGIFIPIVPVFATTFMAKGKRYFEGVVRQAKDAQRAYNFWNSMEAEQISLAPKAPFMVVEGQIEGHEAEWARLNVENMPYLEYKPVTMNGQPAPPPQRQQFDPQIQSIINAKMMSNEDLKATTGIYDPSLGTDQKEASGRALITKQRQAEVTNFHYIDNLSKSLKYAGKILLNIIPIVYDTKRVIRITGGVNEDDENVVINAFDQKDPVFLDVGKYDVEISIGPYGENQRQDAIDSMLALMQINPELAGLIGDIFVAKQDWDGAREISERLKIMLPPQLQQQGQDIPPEIQAQIAQAQQQYQAQIQQDQAQMAQMQQLIAELTSELNKTKAQAESKNAENQIKMEDIASKERIVAMNSRTQLLVAGMKEDAADSRLAFTQELAITGAKQQGQPGQSPNTPEQGDVFVLSGVNDPVTQAQQPGNAQESNLSPDEEQQLLAKLQQHQQYTTKM